MFLYSIGRRKKDVINIYIYKYTLIKTKQVTNAHKMAIYPDSGKTIKDIFFFGYPTTRDLSLLFSLFLKTAFTTAKKQLNKNKLKRQISKLIE